MILLPQKPGKTDSFLYKVAYLPPSPETNGDNGENMSEIEFIVEEAGF